MSARVPKRDESFEGSKILVVDDDTEVAASLCDLIEAAGYVAIVVNSADAALGVLKKNEADLVISDVRMPGRDGFEFCEAAREQMKDDYVPIILLTGNVDEFEIRKGLDSGADDFLLKPPRMSDLLAKVRSLLRIRILQRKNRQQAELLARWNRDLEERVREQVSELHRLERFKAYFSHSVAELIVSDDFESRLKTHRREITSLFIDLRGFTAFAESVAPEEVSLVLNEFYSAVGEVASRYEATVGNIAGDGMLFFFNDPIEIQDHRLVAVSMALDLRHAVGELTEIWKERGHKLGFGVGLAEGIATIGGVGYNQYWTYTVVGSTVNLAARLCAEARDGEILVSDRFRSRLEGRVAVEPRGLKSFKGFSDGVVVFNVCAMTRIQRVSA